MEQRIVTVMEMAMHEKTTMKEKGISLSVLVENAGKALFDTFIRESGYVPGQTITVVSGIGNNGADSLVFAKIARESGYPVKIVILGNIRKGSPEMKKLAETSDEYTNADKEKELSEAMFDTDYVIDGIFGTGIKRDVDGLEASAIELINTSRAFVYSLDIPSGIEADTGKAMKTAVMADMTGYVQYLKFGHLCQEGIDFCGKIREADASILFDMKQPVREIVSLADFNLLVPKRIRNSNKYDYGNILIIGGSAGMFGAPQLSAFAAMRSGAGLVTIAIRKEEAPFMTQIYPEVMTAYYEKPEELVGLLENKDVVLFGPGFGKADKNGETIVKLLLKSGKPLVIDADGLGYFKSQLKNAGLKQKIVITPHSGELMRLLDKSREEIYGDVDKSLEELTKRQITVILKGPSTFIAGGGRMACSVSGNPGMASAGTGDVLAGIVAAMMARLEDPFEAAVKATIIHSEAGRKAKEVRGESGLMAHDLVDYLPLP